MTKEVTMPQLGMTQDSGIIVSWAKAVGDAVKAGELLMEVETDKATMEVEALYDGFLSEIRSPAGSDVPVGDVVAIISSSADTIVGTGSMAETPALVVDQLEQDTNENALASVPLKPSINPISKSQAVGGKILASPKAKQEAKKRGIDLARLAQQGGNQPFHYKDIVLSETGNSNPGSVDRVISVKLRRKVLTSFQDWLAHETGNQVNSGIIVASFAAGALRSCNCAGVEEILQCDIKTAPQLSDKISVFDSDYMGLLTPQISNAETHGRLIIYDLTNTNVTGFSPPLNVNQIAIVLTAASKKKLNLRCHYDGISLTTDQAVAFASDLAGRLSEPLRNLL